MKGISSIREKINFYATSFKTGFKKTPQKISPFKTLGITGGASLWLNLTTQKTIETILPLFADPSFKIDLENLPWIVNIPHYAQDSIFRLIGGLTSYSVLPFLPYLIPFLRPHVSYLEKMKNDLALQIGLGLYWSGLLGNYLSAIFKGYVTNIFLLPSQILAYPSLNLADISFTIGVPIILWRIIATRVEPGLNPQQ